LDVVVAGVVARSAAVMIPAISSISPPPNPSVVSAGVPSRIVIHPNASHDPRPP
jgi:hypothetical protein